MKLDLNGVSLAFNRAAADLERQGLAHHRRRRGTSLPIRQRHCHRLSLDSVLGSKYSDWQYHRLPNWSWQPVDRFDQPFLT